MSELAPPEKSRFFVARFALAAKPQTLLRMTLGLPCYFLGALGEGAKSA